MPGDFSREGLGHAEYTQHPLAVRTQILGGPPHSNNRINILDLTTFPAPVRYFSTDVASNSGDVRWDLSPGPGLFTVDINIVDLTALIAGPSGNPPMLGGVRAFGGPVCPWGP